jgi:hypothetical protein
VTAEETSSVVAEAEVNLGLDIEVNDAHEAARGEQSPQRIDDRIEIRLPNSISAMGKQHHAVIASTEKKLTIMERLYDMVIKSAPAGLGEPLWLRS